MQQAFEANHYQQRADELRDAWICQERLTTGNSASISGLKVADAPRMPAGKPGDEFGAARTKAMREVGGAETPAARRSRVASFPAIPSTRSNRARGHE